MDINLGQGMNGYQLTDHIRKMTKLPAIVALSGGEVDQALARQVGIDHFAQKPLFKDEL